MNSLASFCCCTDRFDSYLVANLGDGFSHNEAQFRPWWPIFHRIGIVYWWSAETTITHQDLWLGNESLALTREVNLATVKWICIISWRLHPVRSESSLYAQWVTKDPSVFHADREDSDQAGRALILLDLSCRCQFDKWMPYFGIMSHCYATFDLIISVDHGDLHFTVQWFGPTSWSLFDGWTSYFEIMSRCDTKIYFIIKLMLVTTTVHGLVILFFILMTLSWMNIILWDNESVWCNNWPNNDLYFKVHYFSSPEPKGS